MRVNRQLSFLIIAFILFCLFLRAVSGILLPFVLGILVAYMLHPVIDRLENKKVHRGFACAIMLVLFYSILTAIGFFTIPLVFQQIEGFMAKLPQYQHDFSHQVMPWIREKLQRISPDLADQIDDKAQEIPANITEAIGLSSEKIFHSGLWLLNLLSLILITPIVSFYLLRDWSIFMAKLYSLLPQNYAPIIKRQAYKIDETISAFLRGQLTVCLILGFYYGISLSILGLNFGFLIGMATGILTFIPYIGLIAGALTGLLVAFFQYGNDPKHILMVGAIFLFGHLAESNIITPKIVGEKIGVHPAWLIFSLLAGGALLGFLGVIIAVPMTAIIGVLVRFAVDQYEHSSYYIRNRNPGHLQQPDDYTPEPGSILAIDEPVHKRKRRSPRKKK